MGVSYELAIEHVVGVLVTKGLLVANTVGQLPAERIKRIKTALGLPTINGVLPSVDERTAATAAYDFADTLRLQRNQAAHTSPILDFTVRGETEEFRA